MKRRLIVVGPLPPPVHGVAVSTSLVLANRLLAERFAVEHLDTSDRRHGSQIGRWDVTNVRLACVHALRLVRRTRGEPGLVYLPLSQSTPGFLRDSLLIHIAALRGWKVVAHLRGSEFGTYYRRQPRPLRGWIRFTLARLAQVAVMGESLRAVLDGLVPAERLAVVPNGTPNVGVEAARRDGETVLFLSNLQRRKGVREALDAALLVLERRPTACFVFSGDREDGELERSARETAEVAGGRIRFLEEAAGEDEKRALLLSASLLLFPPLEPEGHPRVVLEAMAAGLPVVTTDRGAIAETIVDGESGFVLPDPVPSALADRILRLLDDRELRERMGAAARAGYLARFTQERADRVLADWLESL